MPRAKAASPQTKPKSAFPQAIIVYQLDTEPDGTPIYVVARHVDEILCDHDGGIVGIYALRATRTFHVAHTLE